MNIGFAFSPSNLATVSRMPTQAEINFQGAMCGTQTARDSVQRVCDRSRSLNLIGARVSSQKLTIKAANVGAKKRA
jgi:hypothetical protein